MALEEDCTVKFHVVLRLVPSLFYVKCLERNDVPRFHVFFARTYEGRMRFTNLTCETGGHGTRGTKIIFNSLQCSMSSKDVEQI
jgi:hypothetical protein